MTAAQAYEIAAKMYDNNVPLAKISKHLAKDGYLSFRTGKPLRPSSVHGMVKRYKSGHVPTNRPVVKYANKTNKPVSNVNSTKPEKDNTSSITIWGIARLIDESNIFSSATKKALLDLIVREAIGI